MTKFKENDKVKLNMKKFNIYVKKQGIPGKHLAKIVRQELKTGNGVLTIGKVYDEAGEVYGSDLSRMLGSPIVPFDMLKKESHLKLYKIIREIIREEIKKFKIELSSNMIEIDAKDFKTFVSILKKNKIKYDIELPF